LSGNKSIRSQLEALLKPVLPKGWVIISNERGSDVQTKTVLRLSQQSLKRHPQAPLGALLVTFTARVIAPGDDFEKSEDVLDDAVTSFIFAVDGLGGSVAWTDAKKVLFDDALAYDIELTITVDRPTNPK
jgi:hypothetical protein